MEWQESKDNFSMAKVESGDSVDQAMRDFWSHIKEQVIPKNDGIGWDCLRIEFWCDSGRMIAFPSSTLRTDRIEKAGCQIVFSDLLAEYERLADSDLDDDGFVAALLRTEGIWIDHFLDAAREGGLLNKRIQFWDGDSDRPICDTTI